MIMYLCRRTMPRRPWSLCMRWCRNIARVIPPVLASGPCGKFGDKLFTATAVRARRKNAGIAGPTSNLCFGQQVNAAMAAVASSRVIELSARPTRSYPSELSPDICNANPSSICSIQASSARVRSPVSIASTSFMCSPSELDKSTLSMLANSW